MADPERPVQVPSGEDTPLVRARILREMRRPPPLRRALRAGREFVLGSRIRRVCASVSLVAATLLCRSLPLLSQPLTPTGLTRAHVVSDATPADALSASWCGTLGLWDTVYNVLLVLLALFVCMQTRVDADDNIPGSFHFIGTVGSLMLIALWGFYGMYLLFHELLGTMLGCAVAICIALSVCSRPNISLWLATASCIAAGGGTVVLFDYIPGPDPKDFAACEDAWMQARWLSLGFVMCVPFPTLGFMFFFLSSVVAERLQNITVDTLGRVAPSRPLEDEGAVRTLREDCFASDCAICSDVFAVGHDVRVLTCRHAYHTQCIDGWIIDNGHRTCPTCRADVETGEASDRYED
eukprot:Hpha_TRINITY_DN7207_c0_g1::TRINITY_DN7207_c0_g1_i2::g.102229::m.102229